MPVEVRELIIRTTIQENSSEQSENNTEINREQIIAQCVDKVLEILKEKQER